MPREELRYAVAPGIMGPTLAAFSDNGLAALLFGDEPDELVADLRRRFPNATLRPAGADDARMTTVMAHVATPDRDLAIPLDIRGTPFQRRVWQVIRTIPAGGTSSYREVATAIGAPGSVRAVASACAANAIAVAIPCHRVVRTDGGLSGYRWGLDRKRRLLDREAGRLI